MATPEIVGVPVFVTGTGDYGLGLDVYVPSGMTTNLLWVVCGFRYTGSGADGVFIRVDNTLSVLTTLSSTGTPTSLRMISHQFQNMSAGLRRVMVEPSTANPIEQGFVCAVLLRNGGAGDAAVMDSIYNKHAMAVPTATQRQVGVYWSYGATAVSSNSTSILNVDTLPDSLGALEVMSHRGTGQAVSIGFNATGESAHLGAYITVPYAA